MPSVLVRRVLAGAASGAVVLVGLTVHALPVDTPATDIAGDALYAVAAYAGLVVLIGRFRPATTAALAAGWCIAVELFQLTGAPRAIGEAFPPAALLLGAGFDLRDLVVYVAAVAATVAVDAACTRVSRGRRSSDLPQRARRPTMGE